MTVEKLYARGAVKFQSLPADLTLPSETLEFLTKTGLPAFEPDKPLLGLRFDDEQKVLALGARRFLVIGKEVWRDDLLIGIDLASGEVDAVSSQPTEQPLYINASVALFVEFLAEMQTYLTAASQDAPPPVMTMSAEQARARLEAFRRGEVKPVTRVQHFDREKELLRIKKRFRQLDPGSLGSERWWDRILEQARDGLI
jgi:SUKH-4 immunity protein